MQGGRRWLELLCPSCRTSLQQVGHKPIPAQSTSGHWLCAFTPLPQVLLPPLTCLPQGEWRKRGHIKGLLCPPSPPSGHGDRIPALDLSGDCDERPHLPLACKWRVSQVLYLAIKSRKQCQPPFTISLLIGVKMESVSWSD